MSGQDRNLEIGDQLLRRLGKLGRFGQGEQRRAGGECCQKPALDGTPQAHSEVAD